MKEIEEEEEKKEFSFLKSGLINSNYSRLKKQILSNRFIIEQRGVIERKKSTAACFEYRRKGKRQFMNDDWKKKTSGSRSALFIHSPYTYASEYIYIYIK
jgi:hypothetical protein